LVPFTVTTTVSVPVAALLSVTVSVRVWVPTANVTVADAPATPVAGRVDPVHLYVIVSPSRSEPLPLNVTEALVAPAAAVTVWSGPALAVGARLAAAGTLLASPGNVPAVISALLENPSPSESAAKSAAVNAWPALA
jgi:hypothetical protein